MFQARKMCHKHGGYLADISSKEELTELNRALNSEGQKHLFPYWIGENTLQFQGWCNLEVTSQAYSTCDFLKVVKIIVT